MRRDGYFIGAYQIERSLLNMISYLLQEKEDRESVLEATGGQSSWTNKVVRHYLSISFEKKSETNPCTRAITRAGIPGTSVRHSNSMLIHRRSFAEARLSLIPHHRIVVGR
jgi:hypothetical protein